MIDEALKNVAIIGASGKMGRGIALLLLQEMALIREGSGGAVHLHLIDANREGLDSLKPYLKTHLTKFAEKRISFLRTLYSGDPSLISNEEMIDRFVNRALECVNCASCLEAAQGSALVFEAIDETVEVKAALFSKLAKICGSETFFLSNTSSIPISLLNERADLKNKIIGCHFYNPPPVQKLLEIIAPKGVDPCLKKIADALGERLKKTIVYSSDTAGFIGNGHCIPEALYAFKKTRELAKELPLHQAIYLLNYITETYLIRPMGIFQLIDYVGIDVCKKITIIMQTYLVDGTLQDPLLDQVLSLGMRGGQHPDGSQKEGFYSYKGKAIEGYYDFEKKEYSSFCEGDWREETRALLGPLPEGHAPWKALVKDPEKEQKLACYFAHLLKGNSYGEFLAKEYLFQSIAIAKKLVDDGVAESLGEVSRVLKTGFYHLYGPDALFMESFSNLSLTENKAGYNP